MLAKIDDAKDAIVMTVNRPKLQELQDSLSTLMDACARLPEGDKKKRLIEELKLLESCHIEAQQEWQRIAEGSLIRPC